MAKPKTRMNLTEKRKANALKFFSLLSPEKIKEARSLFTPECRHHNPYLAPGMDALLDSIMSVQKDQGGNMAQDAIFDIKNVLVDGEMVAIHTTLQSRSNKSQGMRQVHLFRFQGDKIVEYWDVTQMAPADASNVPNMF